VRAPLRVPGFEEIGFGGEPAAADGIALRNNAFFTGVAPASLALVLGAFRVATLPADTLLYVRNRIARRVFLIVSGSVAVVQNTGDVRTTIALLGAGEFTGERAVLRPALRHLWSAICVEETRVGFADGDALLAASSALPAIGVNVARALHRRVRDASSAIDDLIGEP
jgi:CRP-like cAMP-binding protein